MEWFADAVRVVLEPGYLLVDRGEHCRVSFEGFEITFEAMRRDEL